MVTTEAFNCKKDVRKCFILMKHAHNGVPFPLNRLVLTEQRAILFTVFVILVETMNGLILTNLPQNFGLKRWSLYLVILIITRLQGSKEIWVCQKQILTGVLSLYVAHYMTWLIKFVAGHIETNVDGYKLSKFVVNLAWYDGEWLFAIGVVNVEGF